MHFTLGDLITDIAQNGAESGADTVNLSIVETWTSEKAELRFWVKDNGKGMDEKTLKRIVDPFVTDGIKHPQRKVGLGVPFLIQTAEQSGGGWDIQSKKGEGATTTAWFDLRNVDTPPLDDISSMFRAILMLQGPTEIALHRVRKGAKNLPDLDYTVRKTDMIDALGDLEDTASLILLGNYLNSLEDG
ncbi:MAG: ATP-binding protein [Treponema sp.]|nr:ATP-binding protein [Treponema sp.]